MEILRRESESQFILKHLLRSAALALACCIIGLAFAAAQDAAPPAKLTYTKALKGSTPEFVSITLDTHGDALYEGRKIDEPSSPRPIKLSSATTSRLFQLAGALGNFQSLELESHRKVANLGLKTLTYEQGGRTNKVEFNYTMRREAQELTDLFERVSAVEQHILTLEHAIQYDHLSLPRELQLIQIDLDKKALVDPQLLVPVLEKISRNSRFLHLAQSRAQDILQRVQNEN